MGWIGVIWTLLKFEVKEPYAATSIVPDYIPGIGDVPPW